MEDQMIEDSLNKKMATGASGRSHHFDFLVLALVSEVNFYGIPIEESMTFPLKSISDAM